MDDSVRAAVAAEFQASIDRKGNMCEHMDWLRELASECQHVTEFGVWHVNSTWAFLLGCPGKVVSYDRRNNGFIKRAQKICPEWEFHKENDTQCTIAPTDMLFIDSYHTGEHLQTLLDRHSDKVRKYIALHDTVICGPRGRKGFGGLWKVVEDTVAKGEWKIKEHRTNCCGMTVLERV